LTKLWYLTPNILRKPDNFLVNRFYVKDDKLLRWFKKIVYVFEPILDGVFYRAPKVPIVVIKISSHYRARARAIIEMIHYEKWF